MAANCTRHRGYRPRHSRNFVVAGTRTRAGNGPRRACTALFRVMDMSFANQVLTAVYLAGSQHRLENKVHNVPAELDQQVASLKLAAMNIQIDTLTEEQQRYLTSWQEGTE